MAMGKRTRESDFRHKLRIESRVIDGGAEGDPQAGDWSEHVTRKARLVPMVSTERFEASQDQAIIRRRFWVRADSLTRAITTHMRAVFNGMNLDILAADDVKDEHRYIELVTEQRTSLQ